MFCHVDLVQPLLRDVPAGGLLHVCNAGSCSWQEYGQAALNCAVAAGVSMKARTVQPLAMADLKAFVAKRPLNTTMSFARLSRITGLAPRPWQDAVEEYVTHHWIPALSGAPNG